MVTSNIMENIKFLKWASTAAVLTGITLTNLNIFPLNMIDFHNHILPTVDDGASSLDMSISMLQNAQEQGITDVVNGE